MTSMAVCAAALQAAPVKVEITQRGEQFVLLRDGKPYYIKVSVGKVFRATARVTDPDNDPLSFVWQVVPESTDLKTGGDRESEPKPIEGLVLDQKGINPTIQAPDRPGAYRIFVYVYDGNNNAATANIPVLVQSW